MRITTNILAEDPQQPPDAHRFWTRVTPEMADAQFTWEATAASTLDVYREAAERREH
jgi:hypothetical protein